MQWVWRLGVTILLLILVVLCLANPRLLISVTFVVFLLIVVPRLSTAIRRLRDSSRYGRKRITGKRKLGIVLFGLVAAGAILGVTQLFEQDSFDTAPQPPITQSLPTTYAAMMQYDDGPGRWQLRESVMINLDPIRDVANIGRVRGALLNVLERENWRLEGIVDGQMRSVRNRSIEADLRLLPTPTIHELPMALPTVHLDSRIWYPVWLLSDPTLQGLTMSMGLSSHQEAVVDRVGVDEIRQIRRLMKGVASPRTLVELQGIFESKVINRPPDRLSLTIIGGSEAHLIGTRFQILETYPPSDPVDTLEGDKQERVISLVEAEVLRVSLLSRPFRNALGMRAVRFAHQGIAWGIVLVFGSLAGATLKAEFQGRVLSPLVRRLWSSRRKSVSGESSDQAESSTAAAQPAPTSTARLDEQGEEAGNPERLPDISDSPPSRLEPTSTTPEEAGGSSRRRQHP
jgi:uncharacterized membrane protein YhaH (DUF805 family)